MSLESWDFNKLKEAISSLGQNTFLEKTIEEFNKLSKESMGNFNKILESAAKDATGRTIELKINGPNKITYKTTIKLDGDITNEFPKTPPEDSDIYWRRHKELVNEALATRKEISLKVIEKVGNTIKGIVNPISVSSIDVSKIIEEFTKKQ